MGRGGGGADDLNHVSQAWPAGMAWPRAPSKFAMYRKTISCRRLPFVKGARPGRLAWLRARHHPTECWGARSHGILAGLTGPWESRSHRVLGGQISQCAGKPDLAECWELCRLRSLGPCQPSQACQPSPARPASPARLAWPRMAARARIQNLLSTGKLGPCRKPPFVKGAGPGPGIKNLLSTGKLSPCRNLPFVKGARPGRRLDELPRGPPVNHATKKSLK